MIDCVGLMCGSIGQFKNFVVKLLSNFAVSLVLLLILFHFYLTKSSFLKVEKL